MKPGRVILITILLLFSIIRLASTCNKRAAQKDTREKMTAFAGIRNSIEKEHSDIFRFDKDDKDSLQWMRTQTRSFNHVLDSGIKYYQDNYRDDEGRYKKYLELLFEYKNLLYAYQGWIKYNKEHPLTEKNRAAHEMEYAAYRRNVQSILTELRHKEIWVNFDL
jgi:hypothetical protein